MSPPLIETRRRVWDPFVRVFHWTLVICVLLNSFVVDDDDLHQWLGYLAAALVMVRIVWGFVGSEHARFADFFPTPRRVMHHLHGLTSGRPEFQWGHNPLGALMMLLLMAIVLALGVTGWLQTTDAFWGEAWVQDLHEHLGDGLLIAAGLHATAALIMGRVERTRLIKAMVTGVKERW